MILPTSQEKTIEYYNANAAKYVERTLPVSMHSCYQKFLPHLARGAHILDAGCGSGRDSKFFAENGYSVSAIDASLELVKSANSLTGLPVRHQKFQDLSEKEVYDAVWANASLLHVPATELAEVYTRIYSALKKGGICFSSFKWGHSEEVREDRYFHLIDEAWIEEDLSLRENIELIETWLEEKDNGTWLQVITRKKNV